MAESADRIPNTKIPRWLPLVGGVISSTACGLLLYAWSVFLKPLSATFGWSRAEISLAYSVCILVFASISYPAGTIERPFRRPGHCFQRGIDPWNRVLFGRLYGFENLAVYDVWGHCGNWRGDDLSSSDCHGAQSGGPIAELLPRDAPWSDWGWDHLSWAPWQR